MVVGLGGVGCAGVGRSGVGWVWGGLGWSGLDRGGDRVGLSRVEVELRGERVTVSEGGDIGRAPSHLRVGRWPRWEKPFPSVPK